MSYQIRYGESKVEGKFVPKRSNVKLYLAVMLLLGMLAAVVIWPAWAENFRKTLLPFLSEGGFRAVQAFAENVRMGDGLQSAVEVFCREILNGAAS